MSNRDRLTGLDSSFLHLESGGAHMHVASVAVFRGEAPPYDEFVEHLERRLHLVPRYRQRLALVPLEQGRPVWVDDPHFNVRYHLRHTALPAPGGPTQLKRLASRVFSQQLDRSKPLWEIWLVEGVAGDRFALLAKTHHALVDGVSGVDILTVLFDTAADPAPVPEPDRPWVPRPLPSSAQLLADALLERATVPAEIVRGARAALRAPRRVAGAFVKSAEALGSFFWAGTADQAPDTPLNVRIGPHRRFTWVPASLKEFKAIKSELGGSVNDVVLAAVAGALGAWLREQGVRTHGLELKAMVPVSVRAEAERGDLGNRVAAMWAPLPVGVADPVERLRLVREAMSHLKESGQAVGAQLLTELTGFAPPTIMAQASRLQARQRFFNLVVTNVPGPQFPLYLMGRRMDAVYPMVPLAANQALGIAIMSYDGELNFGLNADFDALPGVERIASLIHEAIGELAEAAAAAPPAAERGRPAPLPTRTQPA